MNNAPPKKKVRRGPKPKTRAEKPAQLTVRLEPETLFGLDIVARVRRTSLSAAAEFLISQQLKVDDAAITAGSDSLRPLAELFAKVELDGVPSDMPFEDRVNAVIRLFLKSEEGRVLFMPAELLQPSERYLAALFWELMRTASDYPQFPDLQQIFIKALLDGERMRKVVEAAEFFETNGMPIDEAAEKYVKLLISLNTKEK